MSLVLFAQAYALVGRLAALIQISILEKGPRLPAAPTAMEARHIGSLNVRNNDGNAL